MGGRGSGPKRDAERDREIALLRAEGLTLAEIGRRFGLTRQAVQKALDRLGGTGGPQRRGQGFGALSAEERRRISSLGGRGARAKGKTHTFTSETAAAGRKGAKVAHERGTAHRFSSEQASAAGKQSGRPGRRRPVRRTMDRSNDNRVVGRMPCPHCR
jgi:hypothetical protein